MFGNSAFDAHEGVHFFHDEPTNLKCLIAVHSTHRGPSAGGCRMWRYDGFESMATDALRLSQGMSYKNAMADLPLGGGKAVIWGNPRTDKSTALFEAFGRAVDALGGRYWTAEDVGVSPADMAAARTQSRYVAGLNEGDAASGDPSPVTARGVFLGIKACLRQVFGDDSVEGRTVAVQGVGHVGAYLCDYLHEAGAKLVITDVNANALREVSDKTGAEAVEPDDIYSVEADVFSPNALGSVINPETLPRLKSRIIAGGANNQLSIPEMGEGLVSSGIVYAPDYVINGGGIINVAAEISGRYEPEWINQKLSTLIDTLSGVLEEAKRTGRSTNSVADAIARARINRVS